MTDLDNDFFAWYFILPQELVDRAHQSGQELAWARDDALRVADLLQRHGYCIAGVDTWLPTRPGPSPLIDDWSVDRPLSATQFIETFRWDPTEATDRELPVHFNFTV